MREDGGHICPWQPASYLIFCFNLSMSNKMMDDKGKIMQPLFSNTAIIAIAIIILKNVIYLSTISKISNIYVNTQNL